jgi:DNA helicase-2/ATP-dependent DNA helicase PcrA
LADWLESLTPAQREAVEHIDGPLLILAGPGSGKTRVVTHRIANLLRHGVRARNILALTFTNKAAEEMRSRVEAVAPGQPVWTSTFHRFCARLLRQYATQVGLSENYTIYDTSDSRQALKRTLSELQIDTTHYTPDRIASGISWAKNNLITADQYQPRPGHPLGSIVAKAYPAYQQRLLASNAVDFDDLLLHVATLLRENAETRAELDRRYLYVLVDEYQDTNLAQYTIARALCIDHPNLAVTGDPDQSIYGWRGANLKNILDFEHDYPAVRVVKLERNYRSTPNILQVADALISHNVRRKPKGLYTENPAGRPVQLIAHADQRLEADAIAARIASDIHAGRRRPKDFAIFYRMNALSRALEFALRDEGVPYQMVNGLEFYQRKEIKDVLGYLQLLNNPRDDVAFLRVINVPPRGIGRASLNHLAEHANRHRQSLLEAAREAGLVGALGKRPAIAIARFMAFYDRLALLALAPIEEILGHVLSESGYQQLLSDSEDEEDLDRLANIQELLTAARQFDERHPGDGHLEEFLEEASLVNDTDAWAVADDRVTLMTLHASKGLEFPVVHIVALEEGILPHERSSKDPDQLEEERRLLFVGMTRAMEELTLNLATYREFRGQRRRTIPSAFLMELPRGEMQVIETPWASSPFVSASDEEHSDPFADDTAFVDAGHADDIIHETMDEHDMALSTPDADESAAQVEDSHVPGGALTREATTTPPRIAAPPRVAAPLITTAAQLEGVAAAPVTPMSPELFHQDMLVMHPDYGLGKIIALSGSGPRRQATVAFAAGAGEKKFMLMRSALRPAK